MFVGDNRVHIGEGGGSSTKRVYRKYVDDGREGVKNVDVSI